LTPSPEGNIDVVVPAQGAGHVLGAQLRALAAQRDAPPFRVVVVLDVDDPVSRAAVSLVNGLLDVCIVEVPRRGAAAARNAGAGAGAGRILLFCDSDDRVGPTWVRQMAEAVESTGLAGGPVVVDRAVARPWTLPFYVELENDPVRVFWGQIPYVVSASMGVRRELFDRVGGFDDRFPAAGGEEVDLCARLGVAITPVTDPDAAVLYTPRTTLRAVVRQRVAYSRGAARVAMSHQLAGVGAVAAADRRDVVRAVTSIRRSIVTGCSFVVLRLELRRLHRRSRLVDRRR
jgi:GT2 family glycosyltransferase